MKDANRMAEGDGLNRKLLKQRFEVVLLTIDSVK
jgi:hypothetical protein